MTASARAEQPVMLAIETSQRSASVAVRDRSGKVYSEPLRAARRHDDDLMPAIDRLFKAADLEPSDLDAVAVSVGPGGFTGLRIAVTTAKLLGETLGATLVPVPSAQVATEAVDITGTIIVALAGKRDSAWLTTLQRRSACDEAGDWSIVGTPGIATADTMQLENIAAMIADQYLPEPMRERCVAAQVPMIEPEFRAEHTLHIGTRLYAAGMTTDPLHLQPLYPREPEAVTLYEQRGIRE